MGIGSIWYPSVDALCPVCLQRERDRVVVESRPLAKTGGVVSRNQCCTLHNILYKSTGNWDRIHWLFRLLALPARGGPRLTALVLLFYCFPFLRISTSHWWHSRDNNFLLFSQVDRGFSTAFPIVSYLVGCLDSGGAVIGR